MPFEPEKEATLAPTTPLTAVEGRSSSVSSVTAASLPKLVMCFDISTLTLQDLKTIASDLKVPSYSGMTKEQLCKVLVAL